MKVLFVVSVLVSAAFGVKNLAADPPVAPIPTTTTGTTNTTQMGMRCDVEGKVGECVDKGLCYGDVVVRAGNLKDMCYGTPQNIICCLNNINTEDKRNGDGIVCKAFGKLGTCSDKAKCSNGKSYPGFCKGPINEIECCVPNVGTVVEPTAADEGDDDDDGTPVPSIEPASPGGEFDDDASLTPGANRRCDGRCLDEGEFVSSRLLMCVMPTLSQEKADSFREPMMAAMAKASVTTPLRVAAFLAQIGHESLDLTRFNEMGGNDYFRRMYENNENLGNDQPGDGIRFHGRGPIQITGRWNYKTCGRSLGMDLTTGRNPDKVASDPVASWGCSLWFWTFKSLNRYADVSNIDRLGTLVNGGANGRVERRKYYVRARACLGLPAWSPPVRKRK